mmetsp:Transcript_2312/g.6169  ORF Transcript_2312/g.6169 Transcript_2312/m.6169 type:complete len:112 (-) Transcript_2312:1184-1519(-)
MPRGQPANKLVVHYKCSVIWIDNDRNECIPTLSNGKGPDLWMQDLVSFSNRETADKLFRSGLNSMEAVRRTTLEKMPGSLRAFKTTVTQCAPTLIQYLPDLESTKPTTSPN